MAKPYLEGKAWAMRLRHKGNDIYVSGEKTAAAAAKAAHQQRADIDAHGAPKGLGPDRTMAAQALQDYAIKRLPFKKGGIGERHLLGEGKMEVGAAGRHLHLVEADWCVSIHGNAVCRRAWMWGWQVGPVMPWRRLTGLCVLGRDGRHSQRVKLPTSATMEH